MSDLDKKLTEILNEAFAYSLDHTLSVEESVPLIKQAFIDAGWTNIPNLRPGDFITVNYSTAVFNGDGTITPIVRMTGQEFYDRFDKEMNNISAGATFDNHDDIDKAYECAKKAAGIE